jgi:hypothetical protein
MKEYLVLNVALKVAAVKPRQLKNKKVEVQLKLAYLLTRYAA